MSGLSHITESNIKQLLAQRIGLIISYLSNIKEVIIPALLGQFRTYALNYALAVAAENIPKGLCDLLGTVDGKLSDIQRALNTFGQILTAIRNPLIAIHQSTRGLLAAVNVITNLLIPQAVLGVGIPINITIKFSEILATLREYLAQAWCTVQSLLGDRPEVSQQVDESGRAMGVQVASELSNDNKIEDPKRKGLRDILRSASGAGIGILDVGFAVLTKVQYYVSYFRRIISLIQVYCTMRRVREEIRARHLGADEFGQVPVQVFSGEAVAGDGSSAVIREEPINLPELDNFLSDFEAELLSVLEAYSLYVSDENTEVLDVDRALRNLADVVDDYESETSLPDGIKSRLRREAILNTSRNTRLVAGVDGVIDARTGERIPESDLDKLSLGEILLSTPTGVITGVGLNTSESPDGLSEDPGVDGINEEFYSAIDGATYRLTVEKDVSNTFELAERRFGAARTVPEGVIVLKSPLTFALDEEVILNDIKVRLDEQLSQDL